MDALKVALGDSGVQLKPPLKVRYSMLMMRLKIVSGLAIIHPMTSPLANCLVMKMPDEHKLCTRNFTWGERERAPH